jgi:hypothetical protein
MDAYNHHESTNADGLTFEAWLNAVDRVLLRVVYVTHDCLGDWDVWRCLAGEHAPRGSGCAAPGQ